MKNMIKVLVLAVAMITFNVSTYAQKSERQRMTREQLAEAQAHFIANEMAMDDTTNCLVVVSSIAISLAIK